MRHVYENPGEAAEKGRLASKEIGATHSLSAFARFIKARMAEIAENPAKPKGNILPAKTRDNGQVWKKTQEVLDELQAKVKALASLEDEMEAAARKIDSVARNRRKGLDN